MPASRREFLAAMAAPAIVRSPHEKRGRAGREPERLPDIPTPALLLDLDALESNVAKMVVHLKARGKAFRPRQDAQMPADRAGARAAGAIGHCVAKLSEVEVFAAPGLDGLLVTTEVVGRQKIARAVALAAKKRDTIFVVDDPQNARDLNDAAGTFGAKPPLRVDLAVDLLYGRTGIAPGDAPPHTPARP